MENFSCFTNLSDSTLTEFEWTVFTPERGSRGNGYAVATVASLFLLTALPWNLFIVCVICRRRLYHQPVIMLLLNLAITNILLCILVMPVSIMSGFASEYIFGQSDLVRCRVCQLGIAIVTLPWISLHTFSVIAVDRLLYLKRPLTYDQIITPRRTLLAIVVIWVLSIAISLPPLFGFGEVQFRVSSAACVLVVVGSTPVASNSFYGLLLLVEIVVPLIVLLVAYIWILCIVKTSLMRNLKKSQERSSDTLERRIVTRENHKAQFRLVILFTAIISANIVIFIPVVVLIFTGAALGSDATPEPLVSIAYLSNLSGTVVQPLIKTCLIGEMRMSISGCLTFKKTCCCKCEKNDTSSPTVQSNTSS